MEKTPERKDIDAKYKWKLEDIYATDEAWDKDLEYVSKELEKLAAFKGRLCESGGTLYEFFKLSDDISLMIEKLFAYAHMRKDEDNSVPKYQGMFMKIYNLAVNASAVTAFAEPEIMAEDEEKLFGFVKETKGLELYEKKLKMMLRGKPHVLSAAEEEILAKAGNVLSTGRDTYTMLSNLELKYDPIKTSEGETELTDGNYVKFLKDKDPAVRKAAFGSMYKTLTSFKNTIAACFVGNLKSSAFIADVSKYESSRDMYLFPDNVPGEVYDSLIDTIHDNLKALDKYMALRKKALGGEIHMYDLYVPITDCKEETYTFEEACELVLKALEPMGEEYVSIAKSGLESGWTDVYETKGKRSGAYSSGCYSCHPFMLLNWQGTINDVFTLIHELGHSMHTYYSQKYQPFVYADYAIFSAEVASTVNENLLMHYLMGLENVDRAYLVNHYLEEFRATVIRQTMFAEFERDVHKALAEKGSLVEEEISKIYYDINMEYYGREVAVDKEISYEWMRIPHFYTPFYVYKYATGFTSATAFAKMIISGNKDGYMEFLKSGGSDYPLELLRKAGVDLRTPEPVRVAMKEFEEYIDELEKMI